MSPGRKKNSVGRPADTDSSVTRKRILEVAGHHFAAGSYGSTSLGAIAKDAGVTTGSVYYHFSSKGALYEAVGREGLQEIMDNLFATLARKRDRQPIEATEALLVAQLDWSRDHGYMQRVGLAADIDREKFPEVENVRRYLESEQEQLFSMVVERGNQLSAPLEEEMRVMVEILYMGIARWTARPGAVERIDTAMRAVRPLLDGSLFSGDAAALEAKGDD